MAVTANEQDFLVLTYHPALSKHIYNILHSSQVVLQCDEENKTVFHFVPMVPFCRPPTLHNILVRAKLFNEKDKAGSTSGCGRRNCQVCNFLEVSDNFMVNDLIFYLQKSDLNCNSNGVIYKLTCKTCNKFYIGSTKTAFRQRFNNYKSHFRS